MVKRFLTGKRRQSKKARSQVKAIARERIDILLTQAREMLDKNPQFSKRYVDLARRISMRNRVRIPSSEKRYLCKGCGQILIPGRNARVRVLPGNPRIIITCLSCGKIKRYPYSKRNGGKAHLTFDKSGKS